MADTVSAMFGRTIAIDSHGSFEPKHLLHERAAPATAGRDNPALAPAGPRDQLFPTLHLTR
jgi:hypothetical protein